MFQSGVIRKMVMKAINQHINNAEKRYEEGCGSIDEKHFRLLHELETKRESDKLMLAGELVKDIVGKVL